MNLRDKFKKAKENNTFIVERSYFSNNITWENILNFIYKESSVKDVEEKNKKTFSQIVPEGNLFITVEGNLSVYHPLWIKGLSGKIWKGLPEIKNFLIKLNDDFDSSTEFENCKYYDGTYNRGCNCYSVWHSEGIVVSLASRLVNEHRDIFDAGYIQLVGQSFWKIEGHKDICILNSGDMLLLPNNLTHEVWGDGPRSGILLECNSKNYKD
jgi:hypothetical protein